MTAPENARPPASAGPPWGVLERLAPLAVLALLAVGACATTPERPPPPVVEDVDLERYVGRWYEIAHLPFARQEGCVGTTATYSVREDGDLKVVNRCREGSPEGEVQTAEGRAWRPDPSEPAKLKVRFFWPFTGDYWVLALDEGYDWAMVGTPDREYLWILSRTPELDPERYRALVSKAADLGYPVDELIRTPQPAG